MKRRSLFVIVFLLFMYSCGTEKQNNGMYRKIEIAPDERTDWESLFALDEVVQFGENEDSVLGVAHKLVLGKQRILFWDYKMKRVYAYNRQGNYLFTIGKPGHAAFECVNLKDVIFTGSQQETIELLDENSILKFDAKDGTFLESKNLEIDDFIFYTGFFQPQDGNYLFSTPSKEETIVLYEENKVTSLRKRDCSLVDYNHFFPNETGCLVAPDYCHFGVDEYRNGELLPKYYFDFGSQALPTSLLPQTTDELIELDNSEPYFKGIVDVLDSENWLFAKAVGPSRQYFDIFVNLQTGRTWSGPIDINLGLAVVALEGDCFWAIAYPEYMSKETKVYAALKEHIEFTEDMNPLLVSFRINEK